MIIVCIPEVRLPARQQQTSATSSLRRNRPLQHNAYELKEASTHKSAESQRPIPAMFLWLVTLTLDPKIKGLLDSSWKISTSSLVILAALVS